MCISYADRASRVVLSRAESKMKEEDSFRSVTTCDYRQGAVIQSLASCDYRQGVVIQSLAARDYRQWGGNPTVPKLDLYIEVYFLNCGTIVGQKVIPVLFSLQEI